jgi:Signal transduction histidine kinase
MKELMAEINEQKIDVRETILNMPFTTDRKSKIELAFYSELIPDLYLSGLVPQLYLSAAQSTQHCLSGGMDESVIYSFSIMGSQNRVYSMALIHEKLYQSKSLAKIDLAGYIQSLTANLFLSYGMSERIIKSKISVENLTLNIDTVIPCALIINELVSNSLKHAFPSGNTGKTGEIHLNLRHDAANKFILTVSDNGISLPEGFEIENCNSLGLKLVSVLVKQLNGVIRLNTSNRTEFMIIFTELRKERSRIPCNGQK